MNANDDLKSEKRGRENFLSPSFEEERIPRSNRESRNAMEESLARVTHVITEHLKVQIVKLQGDISGW